jgi:hypothetical protein
MASSVHFENIWDVAIELHWIGSGEIIHPSIRQNRHNHQF